MVCHGHIAQGLGAQQDADAIGERAEAVGRRAGVAQFGQAVVNQWVSDQVQHGAESLHRNFGFT